MRPPFLLALAWREARGGRRRALLMVVSVAIGVAALVAIDSFVDGLRESVRREARALLGADLALSAAGPFSPRAESLLAELSLATAPAAQAARVVSFAAMAVGPAAASTRLVQVQALEAGYPHYGTIRTDPPGEWPRLAGGAGALVDPGLLTALGASVGDEIALGEARFRIRATVTEMPGDVGIRSALGPRVFIPAARVAETGLLARGSRARHEVFLKLPPSADAARLADRFRSRFAGERLSLRTAAEDQRRLSEAIGRFGSFLGLVGLVALLLGGLGVASAVHVFVQQRLPTIAVLRCLGASARTLLGAYLLQALAVGLAGSLAGSALGAGLQLVLPRLLRDLLPVEVAWQPSWTAIQRGLAIGVWVSAILSLLPLLAVRRVSPLAVLRRDYELPPPARRDLPRLAAWAALAASLVALAALVAGRWLAGLAFAAGAATALAALYTLAALLQAALRRSRPASLPYVYRQGLANLHRPANQTRLVVTALGFGVFLLATLLLVQHNLLRDLRAGRQAERPNLVFFDVQPDQLAEVRRLAGNAGMLLGEAVPIVPMRIEALAGRSASELLAIEDGSRRPERWALRREYRSSFRDQPTASERIVAGSWWRPGEWKSRGPEEAVPIALEAGLARELRVAVGQTITWDIQGVPLPSRVACLREVEWARFEPNFFVVFPEGPLAQAPRSYAVLAHVATAAARARLQREVVGAHPNVSALDLAQVQRAIASLVDRIVVAVRFMALFSLAAGAAVLAGAVAASRLHRVGEGALLRTLGATRAQLLRILLVEYAVLGALATGAALLLSMLAGGLLVRFALGARFSLPGPALLLLLLAVLVVTVGVGLSGSREVWRRPPLEVLRGE